MERGSDHRYPSGYHVVRVGDSEQVPEDTNTRDASEEKEDPASEQAQTQPSSDSEGIDQAAIHKSYTLTRWATY